MRRPGAVSAGPLRSPGAGADTSRETDQGRRGEDDDGKPAALGVLRLPAPVLNDLIHVTIGDPRDPGRNGPAALASRVEDATFHPRTGAPVSYVIAAPRFAGDAEQLLPGTVCVLHWQTEGGLCTLPAELAAEERERPGLRMWRLIVTGPVTRHNRRRYVRVPWRLPARLVVRRDLEFLSGDPLQALTEAGLAAALADLPDAYDAMALNVSEGGLLCVSAGEALPAALPLIARFTLEEVSFELPSSVVWSTRREGAGPTQQAVVESAIAFDDPARHGDALRPLVFRTQLRERRLGLALTLRSASRSQGCWPRAPRPGAPSGARVRLQHPVDGRRQGPPGDGVQVAERPCAQPGLVAGDRGPVVLGGQFDDGPHPCGRRQHPAVRPGADGGSAPSGRMPSRTAATRPAAASRQRATSSRASVSVAWIRASRSSRSASARLPTTVTRGGLTAWTSHSTSAPGSHCEPNAETRGTRPSGEASSAAHPRVTGSVSTHSPAVSAALLNAGGPGRPATSPGAGSTTRRPGTPSSASRPRTSARVAPAGSASWSSPARTPCGSSSRVTARTADRPWPGHRGRRFPRPPVGPTAAAPAQASG